MSEFEVKFWVAVALSWHCSYSEEVKLSITTRILVSHGLLQVACGREWLVAVSGLWLWVACGVVRVTRMQLNNEASTFGKNGIL